MTAEVDPRAMRDRDASTQRTEGVAVAMIPEEQGSGRPQASGSSPGLGGLLALKDKAEQPLPLRETRVRARMVGPACRVQIEQRFANPLDRPVEAVYLFPLPAAAAVTEMRLLAGDAEVRAECRPREEAEAVFEAAREAGHRAGLLERERSEVFSLRVASLPPGEEVRVRIGWVQELEPLDGGWQWRFPTVVAPRFLPGRPIGQQGPGVLPDTDRVPDGSRLQPPLRLEGGSLLDLEVEIHGPVRALASTQHAVSMRRLPDAEGRGEVTRIAIGTKATLDRDFVLRYETAEPDRPALRAWTDGRHSMVLLDPPSDARPPAIPRDATYVIDRSGSMRGSKMDAARAALSATLHGLNPGDRFRLIAFDDRLERFGAGNGAGLLDYDQESLEAADRWIAGIDARGGTRMLPAIQAALDPHDGSRHPTADMTRSPSRSRDDRSGDPSDVRLRSLLFITDGQVWNEAELIAAVHHRRGSVRFFTLGIDSAVNGGLLQRLARAGDGRCRLLGPEEDIEAAVLRFEAEFGSPLIDGLRIDADGLDEELPPTLYAGSPCLFFLDGAPDRLRMTGTTGSREVELSCRPERIQQTLGPIWATRRITALEDRVATHPHQAEGLLPEIRRLALEYGLLSSQTALVAVDRSRSVEGKSVEILQPVELPAGWDPSFRDPGLRSPKVAPRHAAYPASPQSEGFAEQGHIAEAGMELGLGSFASLRPVDAAGAEGSSRTRRKQPSSRSLDDRPSKTDSESRRLSALARRQRADGSFGDGDTGDFRSTIAALLTLILGGNLRRSGRYQRSVQKALRWLEEHRTGHEPAVDAVHALLKQAEDGATRGELLGMIETDPALRRLRDA